MMGKRGRVVPTAGFNVVEVMMATTILLVGFIGLIQSITIGSESLDSARKKQVASQIIDAEVENLRSGAWTAITALPASATITINSAGTISGDTTRFTLSNHSASANDDNQALTTLARGFTCKFTRTYLRPAAASASTATYLKITYTVTWKSNTGKSFEQTVDTYLGMNGLHLSYQQS